MWIRILCGLEFYVDWNFMWIGILCGLEFYVDWNFMWIRILCGLEFYEDWNSDGFTFTNIYGRNRITTFDKW